ncbi:MAG: hypothetical protein ACJ790_11745 [Myxococcaceae bacterium]
MRVLVCLVLWCSVASAAQFRVATLNLTGVEVDEKKTEFLSDHFAQALAAAGATVTSSRDVAAAIGMERQRMLLGCDEGTSCVAEIASALGVDALASGDIAKIAAGRYQVNLKIVKTSDGHRLATQSFRVDGDEALLDGIDRASLELVKVAAGELHMTLSPPRPMVGARTSARGSVRKYAWIPLVAGIATASVGTLFLFKSEQNWSTLSHATQPSDAQTAARDGQSQQNISRVCLSAGGALVLGAAVMYLVGGEPEQRLSLATDGRSIALAGSF